MAGLTDREISIVVNRYIGVTGGYLGDFSYNTHAQFYPEYCDLDINPNQYERTTKQRFIAILKNASPQVQAKILRGILDRFPLDAKNKPLTRTSELFGELQKIISRLVLASPIETPELKTASAVVERAINDMDALMQASDSISGVDRVHTALHGYLRAVCDKAKIPYSKDDSLTKLFKLLRHNHPSLNNLGARSQDIDRILQSLTGILDALNAIRNNASVAHPNAELLGRDEAMLVINAARTLMHYFNSKFD